VRIPLDRRCGTPLYQQIEAYLRHNILAGSLAPETRLPATRQLAKDLGISRITVKNAYAALESDGLIGTREGSGTYVLPPIHHPQRQSGVAQIAWPLWQLHARIEDLEARETAAASPSPQARHPQPIAFTGVGDPCQFPVADFYKAMQAVIRRDGTAALEYDDFDNGYAPLRQTITHVLASQGIQAHPDQVLVTSGSQQALALTCQILLKPGDAVVVERPTYNLALELFRSLQLNIVGVPIDEHGMQTDALEAVLQQQHPRLIYTIPNFQNPSGMCLSAPRRRQLVALADRYNVPILEDDFVGDLRYGGRALPAIKALDPGGRVIYIGSFSKMLMPGLRVGYLLADGPVFSRLVRQKRVTDLTTSTLMQRTLDLFVTVGRYQAHLRRSCRSYRRRRDAMLAAIQRHLPADVQVDPPQGGLFIWLRLPAGLSSQRLLPLALEAGVEFAPGGRFFPNPADGARYLRLNFATQTPEAIEQGIQRLGQAVQRLMTMKRN
jgi:GntR family transcriptional regulator / MocR family aminotransferase